MITVSYAVTHLWCFVKIVKVTVMSSALLCSDKLKLVWYSKYNSSSCMRLLKCLDVFSGIGGFSLALKDVCKTVAYCEIDEGCQKVLLETCGKRIFTRQRSLET